MPLLFLFHTGEIQRVYRGHLGRRIANHRQIAVHWAKTAVIKMKFLVTRKHRRARRLQYQQQHYSVTQLQSEYRRWVSSNETYDERTLQYQMNYQQEMNQAAALHSCSEIMKGSASIVVLSLYFLVPCPSCVHIMR